MILLHNVVEILDFADFDRGAMFFIVALDGRFIGGTPIDGDLLWHAVATDRLGQKAFRTGLAHLSTLVPSPRRAKHAGQGGVAVEGGTVPTRDWFLNLQILTSGGFR